MSLVYNSWLNIINTYFIQLCLEGEVSQTSASDALKRGKRAAGDLIPWTISGCFQDEQFPSLAGARIVRIATHPDYQSVINYLY